jgi:signal transduction histidine kinase
MVLSGAKTGRRGLSEQSASRLAWGLAAVAFLTIVVTATLAVLNRHVLQTLNEASPVEILLPIGYSLGGALVASRRPHNPIGWLMLGIAIVTAIPGIGYQYVIRDLTAGALPGAAFLGWLWLWVSVVVFPCGLVVAFVLLFPDGHLPSRRWRWVLGAGILFSLVGIVSSGLVTPDITPIERLGSLTNPFAVNWFGDGRNEPLGFAWLFAIAILAIAVVGAMLRLRRSQGDERQQLKWFVYAVAATIAGIIALVLSYVFGLNLPDGAFTAVIVFGFGIAVPLACGVAILKHGLYEIDVVIRKTVVYVLLAAFATAVYVALVVGIGAKVGRGNSFLTMVAAVVVALTFQPLRHRLMRLANRLVYGKRATPYEVLSEFSERVGGTYASDDLLPRMARVVAEGTGAERADVWMKVGGELRVSASWPASSPGAVVAIQNGELPDLPGADVAFPVRHQGELLGALSVSKRPADPITHAEKKLVADLAAQTGLVLKNVRLTTDLEAKVEQLRALQKRLISTQDEERRKLERDIHDGAQQQLVAMSVQLKLLSTQIDRDTDAAKVLAARLLDTTTSALEDLRNLARGIYPPLLVDKGLVAALQAQARKVSVPVEVVAGDIGRLPQEIEAAAYFCALEALQNIAKYAQASGVTIEVLLRNGCLELDITDDGVGFDPSMATLGTGLRGMADRLAALDGSLQIHSEPGAGTAIIGTIPTPANEKLNPS